jgi:predicted PurR-regulated permease PerM
MLATLFKKRDFDSAGQPPVGTTKLPARPKVTFRPNGGNLPGWIFLPTVVLVVAILYWAQEILVPLAVAIMLTFILTPVVAALERLRLGRIASVAIAAILALSILLGVGWIVIRQMAALGNELPQYRINIIEKITYLT